MVLASISRTGMDAAPVVVKLLLWLNTTQKTMTALLQMLQLFNGMTLHREYYFLSPH